MTVFQRARSQEQREVRRRAILDTAAAMLAAYQADPALAAMRPDFAATVREVLEVLLSGLLARSSR